ncbi:putative integral membrane protein [Streptomyces venezuelae]|uniref:hypothetical protein n=1 Tax=Streptomyces gardneri TaxID=66892 RepID=UPI0006BC8F98|nr:hypothetical protein [Streptomyces gardneri]ALO09900.1 putative integral membrane protein [Streptomyces venezuelae]QPK46950.1 hypothetical protein H4W23_21605 [Streptomyces gardneri]WRK38361.1 hypothetical protein U0M97_21705 [Streptomyces venezuelae]CUM39659.1 FIG00761799: membrane protein [Streptomyces venezuelae]
MSLGDEHDGFGGVGGSGQTRTRLPEGNSGDVYGGARRPVRTSRSLITVVSVVVLLIAAIAFANRGGGDPADAAPTTGTPGAAAPTAATGVRPVNGKNGQIPAGYAHDEQGAQSAATNYAVVLGSAEMFQDGPRAEIVRAIHDPTVVEDLLKKLDASYSAGLMAGMGLDENGTAPSGLTFVSRTVPIGTKVRDYTENSATVEVWCTGLGGLAGAGSTKPVTSTWFTITQKLKWVGNDWRVESFSQSEGPTPVNGDSRASTADEIAEAVEGYGGFTYAR